MVEFIVLTWLMALALAAMTALLRRRGRG